jgi:RNA polymerase sigma-70 factor (ECF subfamily)
VTPAVPPADPDVFERISSAVRVERGALARVARSEGLAAEDAVDCVQDALCTLLDLAGSGQLDAGSDWAPILVTIVRNAARNQRRRHFRSREHVEWGPHEPREDRALPEELVARAENVVRLRACVAELCEIQRAVVTLRLLEERPGENVAHLLGVSNNHVAVLLYRAKASLRECMIGSNESV